MGEPVDCHDIADTAGSWDVYLMAAVMVHGGANVESMLSVGSISGSLLGCFMGNDFGTWWRYRCSIEIKVTIEASIGRQLGMSAG